MLYEYSLIAATIACGYWGWFFFRRTAGTPTYAYMLFGAAALSGLGLVGLHNEEAALGIVGAIGLGTAGCLLVLAPVIRALARRAAQAEYLGLAARLLDIADLLAPGAGAADEKAVLASMVEIRDGRVEPTVAALAAAKRELPPPARYAIDERIVLLYLAAFRWQDAIDHAESTLLAPAGPVFGGEAPDAGASMRAHLGISPPVFVELIGAYGRVGKLDKSAQLIARLENVSEGRPEASLWLHRGRLVFLALAGRTEAVRQLTGPEAARHMSIGARTYWLGVAHQYGGDAVAAEAAYQRARLKSRGRPRDMIDRALASLARDGAPLGEVEPTALTPLAVDVIARVEAAPLPGPIRALETASRPWAAWVLVVTPLVVSAAIAALIGPSSEPGSLVRGGAMVRGFVEAGEWWRLVSYAFVHVGPVHLAVNVLGLFFLARTAEELYGGPRTIVLFGLAGIASAAASFLGAPTGISAGATGAVFGVLGAVFVELALHRAKYRAAWKRGLWSGLAIVTIAQLAVGLAYPSVDQWAHVAGLGTGIVVGAALSRHAPWPKVSRVVGVALALAYGLAAVGAAILVATRPIAASLAAVPSSRHETAGLVIEAPARWTTASDGLVDPDGLAIVDLIGELPGDIPAQLDAWSERARAAATARELQGVVIAKDRAFQLPLGWQGQELTGHVDDELGNRQHYRVLVASRPVPGALMHVSITTPQSIALVAPPFYTSLLTSIEPRVPAVVPPLQ